MTDTLVTVDNVSKKFCRRFKHALWYGVKDLAAELAIRRNGTNGLRKHEFWALKDVSLELKRGQTLGLIGPNGAGKTTLLRLLNGLIKPDKGRIEVRGRMQALIALGAGFNPVLTGRENIYVNAAVLGLSKAEVDRRLEEIVEFSGLQSFIDAPLQSYSSGMVVRLGFAVAANMNPAVLLIDEVLAVGDEGFQAKCLNKIGALRRTGTAVILVSHNMHTMSTFATAALLLNEGKCAYYESAGRGIAEYKHLFSGSHTGTVEELFNGNGSFAVDGVMIQSRHMHPGESFNIVIRYTAMTPYCDVQVDTAIYSDIEPGAWFQATNQSYGKQIDILQGIHELKVVVRNIPIQSTTGTIGIAIWAHARTEVLFWWRIPVEFYTVENSDGRNHLQVDYECTL